LRLSKVSVSCDFSGVLMCTDVAARGVDFPAVDWVLQYDPPSSAKSVLRTTPALFRQLILDQYVCAPEWANGTHGTRRTLTPLPYSQRDQLR
jgi:hypothetical protein